MSDAPLPSSDGGKLLDKKISGIKAQYLILFGLAVAIGAFYYRKYRAKKYPVAPVVVDTSGQAAGPTISSSDGGNGGIGAPVPPTAQTNAQWARAALNAAIGNGSVDATDGANAVTSFLNGQPLTPSQVAIMAKLVTAYGQPPEGVLPIVTTPLITATPTPTPTPSAPAPAPAVASAPSVAFPLDAGSYFGPRSGPANSISGYYNNRDNLTTFQQKLASLGYAVTPDGLYGPQTAGVTRAFQAANGLQVDGLIGPQTWAAAFK